MLTAESSEEKPERAELSRMRPLLLNHHRQFLMHSLFLVALEIARERSTRIEHVSN